MDNRGAVGRDDLASFNWVSSTCRGIALRKLTDELEMP